MTVADAYDVCRAHWFECNELRVLSRGRINDTYRLQRRRDGREFVLQRLNALVFADPLRSMQQTARIAAHLARKQPGWAPELVPTREDAAFVQRGDAQVWRMWRYVDASTALDDLATEPQLFAAGHAYGHTQELLRDLPGSRLQDPIPGLFDLAGHLARLAQVAAAAGRGFDASEEDLLRRSELLEPLARAIVDRNCYVHGDSKPANLLFAPASVTTQQVVVRAVVDFDTTMYGHWAWDFGDLIRSAACADGAFVSARVAPLVRGYLQGSPRRRDEPSELLELAPRYVAACLAVRYLIDHLQGDLYFKVLHTGDNLHRAAQRMALVDQIGQARGELILTLRQLQASATR